jgi:hypothetical protein
MSKKSVAVTAKFAKIRNVGFIVFPRIFPNLDGEFWR